MHHSPLTITTTHYPLFFSVFLSPGRSHSIQRFNSWVQTIFYFVRFHYLSIHVTLHVACFQFTLLLRRTVNFQVFIPITIGSIQGQKMSGKASPTITFVGLASTSSAHDTDGLATYPCEGKKLQSLLCVIVESLFARVIQYNTIKFISPRTTQKIHSNPIKLIQLRIIIID